MSNEVASPGRIPDLTPYERAALREIDAFKNPHPTVWTWLVDALDTPFAKIGGLVMDTPLGEAIAKSVQGIINLLNDGASWSVRTSAIFEEYARNGHTVHKADDIGSLSLENVDRVVGYLGVKYKTLALVEGAATGAGGWPGIAADIPLIVGLALRAVSEYATYYGFDISIPHERTYVLEVLAAGSSPTMATKHAALAEMTRIGALAANKAAWADLEKIGSVQVIKKVADIIGVRLTKAKVAQVVPIVGAAVGGGINAWYMASITESAYVLYRERFLVRRYGVDAGVPVRD